jgi:hypothetical protein
VYLHSNRKTVTAARRKRKENLHLSIPKQALLESGLQAPFLWGSPYPERGVDPAGESVQDVDGLMLVQQDETEEDLK